MKEDGQGFLNNTTAKSKPIDLGCEDKTKSWPGLWRTHPFQQLLHGFVEHVQPQARADLADEANNTNELGANSISRYDEQGI